MKTITISHKFQIVISKKYCKQLGLKSGQRLQIIYDQNQLVLIPLTSISEMRGFIKGIDTTIEREGGRV